MQGVNRCANGIRTGPKLCLFQISRRVILSCTQTLKVTPKKRKEKTVWALVLSSDYRPEALFYCVYEFTSPILVGAHTGNRAPYDAHDDNTAA